MCADWNTRSVERYDQWFETPQGSFAFAQERRLIARMIASWPRRGQRLLEAGCGTGRFLDTFWQAGFDVTGLDAAPSMLAAARKRMCHRADLHLGDVHSMPFGDKEFDYVALLTVLEFCENPEQALREACRIARKGLLVAVLNKYSLYYLSSGLALPFLPCGTLREVRWLSPFRLRSMVLRATGPKPYTMRSILLGPPVSWRQNQPWSFLNSLMLPLHVGAFCTLRVNLLGERAMTPLIALNTQPRTS